MPPRQSARTLSAMATSTSVRPRELRRPEGRPGSLSGLKDRASDKPPASRDAGTGRQTGETRAEREVRLEWDGIGCAFLAPTFIPLRAAWQKSRTSGKKSLGC